MLLPWQDRAGRFSVLRSVALLAAVLPGAWIIAGFAFGLLGPRPYTAAIHLSGLWAVRFLLVSLAITPLRRAGILPRLIIIRRLTGLTALAYGLAHLGLYTADQGFDLVKVASEIAARYYLIIGLAALLGLIALGVTSTDAMIRRMGRGWHRLHLLSYPIALLALYHYALQLKIDVTAAVILTGVFVALMAARVAVRAGLPLASPVLVLGLAGLAGLATAGIEAGWYAVASGVDPARVLAANLDVAWRIAPAWWVAGSVAVVAVFLGLRWLLRMVPGLRASGA